MEPSSTDRREEAILRLIHRTERMQAKGAIASQRFSRWRMGIFLAGAAITVGVYQQAWFHTGNGLLLVFLIGFLTISWFHQRLKSRLHRLQLWLEIKKDSLARLRLDWPHIPANEHHVPERHPFAIDLDLTGQHSLLALIDTTFSSIGQHRVATWLFQSNLPESDGLSWTTRQTLVKELTPLSRLRDRCLLASRLISPVRLNGTRIISLLETPISISHVSLIILAACALTSLTIGLGFWTLITGAPNFWLLPLTLYLGTYFLLSGSIHPLFGRVLSLHEELEKLVSVIATLEGSTFPKQPTILKVCQSILTQQHRPTRSLKQLSRICQGLSVKAHPLIHLGLNALVPWDLWFVGKLNRLITRLRTTLPDWLDTVGTLDAASALARYAYLNPDYLWPELETTHTTPDTRGLTARGLGHPLITRAHRITNDLELRGEGHLLLVTGSNMSGKSTFLRTVGINLCLAQAGGPVCARVFSWTWLRLYCCIRVTDALDEGLSYFYAEVKRLKVILEAVESANPDPVIFLIDEIYRGTNNRERLAGSEAFVHALQQSRGLGMISTHDLELTGLASGNGHIRNAHFQETVKAGTLHFDYQLRPGPCPTTNALRIMAQEGLPVPPGHSINPQAPK
ncbi:MAG: MutS family DNA mismatch repair protein [Nitrospirales bacterium]|nr:MutS family DNA mismatch repair protein [Nitrospirales bacterium]MDR4462069.1 MutS family DNA mismatch repair protein [Nitrospirales bacterium]